MSWAPCRSIADVDGARGGRRRGGARGAAQPHRPRSLIRRLRRGTPAFPYVPGCEAVGRTSDGGTSGSSAEESAVDAGRRHVPSGSRSGTQSTVAVPGRRRSGRRGRSRDRRARRLAPARLARASPGRRERPRARGDRLGRARRRTGREAPRRRAGRRRRTSEKGLERAVALGADETVRLDAWTTSSQRSGRRSAGTGRTTSSTRSGARRWSAAVQAAAPRARRSSTSASPPAPTAELASGAVRGKCLTILGHSTFAMPEDKADAEHYRPSRRPRGVAGEIVFDVERVPLDDVAYAWRRQAEGPAAKLVLVP